MIKRISKSDAIKALKEVESLEIIIERIDRSDTASTKRSRLNRFVDEIQKQIQEERDVVLISVKVK